MAKKTKALGQQLTVTKSVTVWVSGLANQQLTAGKSYPIAPTPEGWDKADHAGQIKRLMALPPGSVCQFVADIAVKKNAAEITPAK